MPEKILMAACICCGGDIKVSWKTEMDKDFALACDACPDCWNASCTGISVAHARRWCNVYGCASNALKERE